MIAFTNIDYTIELTEALSKVEDVVLMIPDHHKERFNEVIDSSLNVQSFHTPRIRHLSNFSMIFKIIKRIKQFAPDIIHIQKGHPWLNFALFLLKRYCLITTIHDVILLDFPSKRIPEFMYKPPIKYATQLIVHGHYLKENLAKLSGRSSDDIHVLPRGVNSVYTRFIKKKVQEEKYTIMYFGRIWGYKGLKYLIESEPLISKLFPDLKIIIAGTGEDFKKYEDMMVNKQRFEVYNDFISHELVGELFQRASIIVLPYVNGSQSGVIPQAYALKKPVVITKVGSLVEAVDNGKTGCIVPPKDTKSLAEAIIDLLDDQKKRKKMGENAYKKTLNELAWKNIAVDTLKVYRKALSMKK